MSEERLEAALALNRVAHDLVPGIRHDFGLLAEERLESEGWRVHPQEQALDVERLRARVATLWHFGGEGDDCDGSEAMWCQACWEDTASLVDPDTTLGLYREADAEYARLASLPTEGGER